MIGKLIRSTGIIAAVLFFFGLMVPADTWAKEPRGADVIVTRLDGVRVRGELIAVKPDSLLLISEGTGVTVAQADLKTVRIVRKSRALPWAIGGTVSGALEAALIGHYNPDTITRPGAMAIAGVAQGLLGLGIGLGLGADAVIEFEGVPAETARKNLDRLKRYSRENRVLVIQERRQSGAARAPLEKPKPPAKPRPYRFRLDLGLTKDLGLKGVSTETPGAWAFPEDFPPDGLTATEMPVFQYTRPSGRMPYLQAGPFSLAYELSDHWLAEIELMTGNRALLEAYGMMSYLDPSSGRTYSAIAGPFTRWMRFHSVLIGFDYRSAAPTTLQRLVLEAGAAVGPALGAIGESPSGDPPFETPIPADRRSNLSARVRAAADFYFFPSFSLGVFATYRYLEVEASPFVLTGQVTFTDMGDGAPFPRPFFTRLAHMEMPAQTVLRSGFSIGARITFRL